MDNKKNIKKINRIKIKKDLRKKKNNYNAIHYKKYSIIYFYKL